MTLTSQELLESGLIFEGGETRLDKFLSESCDEISRSRWTRLIEESKVLVDGKPTKPSHKLGLGAYVQVLEIDEREHYNLEPFPMDLDILFEDDHMLVVNKPRGLATHPAASLKEPSLVNALLAHTQLSNAGEEFRPGIVHRLDKETTGLLVVAKNVEAHHNLALQIEKKAAERRYLAVCGGWPEQEQFIVDAPIGRDPHNRQKMAIVASGKQATTHVLRMARLQEGVLIGCRLETGRTHQIRVHLRSIGLPIYGDTVYSPKEYQTGPLQLHAALLRVAHPVSGEKMEFFCEPPADFLGHGRPEVHLLKAFDR